METEITFVEVGQTITFALIDAESGTYTGETFTGKISAITKNGPGSREVTFEDGRIEMFDSYDLVEISE